MKNQNSRWESPDGTTYGYHACVDLEGNPVARTPQSHPYSYDFYVTWKKPKADLENIKDAVYSDRLNEYDYQKCQRLKMQHFGNQGDVWDNRSPKKIEAFLSDYYNREVELIAIMKGCDVSSGFHLWTFHYNYE